MPALKDRLYVLLPWLGALLLAAGLLSTPLLSAWPDSRTGELAVLALATAGLAHLVRRIASCRYATALLGIWLLLLLLFAGPVAGVAALAMLLAALCIGLGLFPQQPPGLQASAGLVVLAALLGWSLQLPIHFPWIHAAGCLALLAWQRHALLATVASARQHWSRAASAAPRSAALAVMVLGLASTACWLPTLQYDDLAYHLRLPWQLMEHGYYQPVPEHQVWAMAAWGGDVLQAMAQVMARGEARGPLNAVWLALLGSGAWQLATRLGGGDSARWLASALVASLPLTAGLAAGMQTELPSAAILLWLCVWVAQPSRQDRSVWPGIALLFGGLLASKPTAAAIALPVLAWALARHRWPPLRPATFALAGLFLVGCSSYVQAWVLTGNPLLPLFNASFQSPYFPPVDFADTRYHAGFGISLPWDLTFHSADYYESHAGAAGVVLVALAGFWLAALLRPATRGFALVALVALLLPLLPMQYLRYAYPGMVLLCVLAAACLHRTLDPRPAHWLAGLLVAICLLNLAWQANGYWMLRNGAVKLRLKHPLDDAPLFARYAPERALADAIRRKGTADGTVLVWDARDAYYAEFGRRGRTVSWYAPALQQQAAEADADPSAQRWLALLREQHVRHVITPDILPPVRQLALERACAQLRQQSGSRQWWQLAGDDAGCPR